MVYDDSAFNDCFTLTDSYSVYPNAFNSYSNDGRYTKHIYIGSERIASQLSETFPAQGDVAGYNVGIHVDYANKRDLLNAQIDSAYTAFGLVYKGINHDVDNYYPFNNPNYWNNAHHAPSVDDEQVEQAPFNSQRDMVYYYHKDHLGSSTFLTNDSACVTQQIEYLPYGEVFLEKQRYTSDYQTPYRFNGKELDEETGLYYYGARYMNPRLSIWYGCDPLQEKYPNITSYTYCAGNPVRFFDEHGDSVAVLKINSQHIALLVQRDDNKWAYYSVNGNNVYFSGSFSGGRKFDDLGDHTFSSPQEFLNSRYNSKGDKNDNNNKNVAGYSYTAAFIIPTSKRQDKIIRNEFTRISQTEEYSLDPANPNHCATVVQRSLEKAGINTKAHNVVSWNIYMKPLHTYTFPYFPSEAYQTIKINNTNGHEIKRHKK